MSKHYKETYKVGDKVIITSGNFKDWIVEIDRSYNKYSNEYGVNSPELCKYFGNNAGCFIFADEIRPAKEHRFKQLMNLYEQHKKTEGR